MSKTSIEWTEHSINPIRARNKATGKVGHFCEKISSGCANCYASTWNEERFGTGLPFIKEHRDAVELFLDESKLQEVLRRKKPTTYFWCDMTDMFWEGVPDGWVMRCLDVMARTYWHTHQILTKRADRMADFFRRWADLTGEDFEPKLVRGPEATRKAHPSPRGQLFASMLESMGEPPPGAAYPTFDWMEGMIRWPDVFPNIWVGVSVEDQQRADERIPHLLNTPAAVRFLSCEPLLGPVDLTAWIKPPECGPGPWDNPNVIDPPPLDWVILGGESGYDARPCHIENVRSLVSQCKAADVAPFVKQLGSKVLERIPDGPVHVELLAGLQSGPPDVYKRLKLKHPKGGDPSEWPADLRVREFPKGG